MTRLARTTLLSVCLYTPLFVQITEAQNSHWRLAGAMTTPRASACSALLSDGRILIAGGEGPRGDLASAEFLGTDGTFSAAPDMLSARSRHTCVTLQDGRVLVAGGMSAQTLLQSAEIYDPIANAWSAAGAMTEARAEHTETLLADGRVLLAGGETIEIFDPATNQFSTVAAKLSAARKQHAAALLPDGRVLIAGGLDGVSALDSTDIFDPRSGEVTPAAHLSMPRSGHTATALPDGRILIAGGSALASAEVFDPATMTFSAPQPMNAARSGHLAFLLPGNNNVLIVGGRSGDSSALNSAEIYTPWTGMFSTVSSLSTARVGAIGCIPGAMGLAVVSGGANASGPRDGAEAFHFPTLEIDRESDLADEGLTVRGRGWEPGEAVRLMLDGPGSETRVELTAIADAEGTIASLQFPAIPDAGAVLRLQGSGRVWQAQIVVEPLLTVPTNVILTGSANLTVYGQSVTLSATVNATIQLGPITAPSGTVTFKEGATSLGSATLSSGHAALVVATLAAGAHTITAVYSGDAFYSGSTSQAWQQTVNKAQTEIHAVSAHNPSTYGNPATTSNATCFNYDVRAVAPGAGTPSGSTSIFDGTNVIASGEPVSVVNYCKNLTAGAHTVQFTYDGDANFLQGKLSLPQTVQKAVPTVSTPTISPSSPVSGQEFTLTSGVSDVLATGTMQLILTGPTAIDTFASLPLVVSGGANRATKTLSSLQAFPFTVSAKYNGDSNFESAVSGNLSFHVNQANTTVSVTHVQTPSSIVLTVTVSPVSPGAGQPNGTVYFQRDGSVSLSATTTNSVATLTDSVGPGTHTYKVVFAGDDSFTPSPAVTVTISNGLTPTTTALTTSKTSPAFGELFNLTATVTPSAGSGTPGGSVQIVDDGVTGSSFPLSAGQAIIGFAINRPGTHAISVIYIADSSFAASTSNTVTVTVGKATTGFSNITASPDPVPLFGTLTISGHMNPLLAIPAPFGTVTLQIDGQAPINNSLDLTGGFAFVIPNIDIEPPDGSHTFKIIYSGDANFSAVTSNVMTLDLTKASSSISLDANPATAVFGQNVVLRASITAQGALAGSTQFMEGSSVLLSVLGTAADHTASTPISSLAVGAHSIKGVYAGDTLHTGSTSQSVTVTVNKAASAVQLTSSLNPSQPGQLVTLTATVNVQPPGGGTATGSVQFLDGGAALGTAALSGGVASFSTSSLASGTHNITAVYSGDGNVNASTSTAALQTVASPGKASTAVVATVSSNTPVFGQTVSVSAAVSGSASSSAQPTGSAQLLDGAAVAATATLSGGNAQFTVGTLTAGAHLLTVLYAGDGNYNGSSSAAVSVTVSKVSSVLQLTSAVNPSTQGQAVAFTATLTPGGAATGQVQFLDGATPLGSSALNGGTAFFSTSTLTPGAHNITAAYSGDNNVSPSVSMAVVQTVSSPAKGASNVTATVSSNAPVYGQPIAVAVVVSGPSSSGAQPGGTVQLLDGGAVAASAAVNAGSAQFTIATLSAGSHTLSVLYSGDNNFNGSTSAATTVNVSKASATLLVGSSVSPSMVGQPVTLTVTWSSAISGLAGPTGTVQFIDGDTVLGTAPLIGGAASFTIASLTAGTHAIHAAYSGDNNYNAGSSSSFSQSVSATAPSIAISAVVNGASFVAGQVSAGEIITIFGTGLGPAILTGARLTAAGTVDTSLSGTTVLFDGVPAPLVYTSAKQVAAVVPYSVGGQATTQLQVSYQGAMSPATTLAVAGSAPAIFTADASGNGQGAIQNQDTSYNSSANPAAAGSIIVLYGTGEGLTDPSGVDGKIATDVLPKPVLPVSVQIGGLPATLDYYGAAPGGVAGEFQINVTLPPGLPSGPASVTVKIGDKTSQSGVTVALQ